MKTVVFLERASFLLAMLQSLLNRFRLVTSQCAGGMTVHVPHSGFRNDAKNFLAFFVFEFHGVLAEALLDGGVLGEERAGAFRFFMCVDGSEGEDEDGEEQKTAAAAV